MFYVLPAFEIEQAIIVGADISNLVDIIQKANHSLRRKRGWILKVLLYEFSHIPRYIILELRGRCLEHETDFAEIQIIHEYPNRQIAMDVHIVVDTAGSLSGRIVVIDNVRNFRNSGNDTQRISRIITIDTQVGIRNIGIHFSKAICKYSFQMRLCRNDCAEKCLLELFIEKVQAGYFLECSAVGVRLMDLREVFAVSVDDVVVVITQQIIAGIVDIIDN